MARTPKKQKAKKRSTATLGASPIVETAPNAPDDCPDREPGSWCVVRVAVGLIAGGLEG